MSPVTEQLIRDYVSRLSNAARGQLGPDDRRALVDKTRDFIEHKTGQAGPPTAFEVARFLFALGDPAELVQQERQRLVALRGETPAPEASRNPIARALWRDPGKSRGASWHWPAVAGGRTELQLTLLDSDGSAAASGNGANGNHHDAPSDGEAAAGEVSPQVPAQRIRPDWFFRKLGGRPAAAIDESAKHPATPDESVPAADPATPDQTRPAWPLVGADGPGPPSTPELADTQSDALVDADADTSASMPPLTTDAGLAWPVTRAADQPLPRYVRRASAAFADWYSTRPLEASAVILLGVGGVIYPPVWLLGAIVALLSRLWDGRDKWLGLALPILLTIVAVALGVTVGGHASFGHSVHEGWVFGVIGSRLAALGSATYLGWRSLHERRPPAVPPWNRPHKVS